MHTSFYSLASGTLTVGTIIPDYQRGRCSILSYSCSDYVA
jgi:hypothetical protein